LAILVLLTTAATGCAALGNKLYAKAGLSQTKSGKKPSQFSGEQDHSDVGGQIGLGWTPIKFLGVEVAYVELGESKYDGYWTPPGGVATPDVGTIDRSAIRASVLGILPITDRWSVFAKGGMAWWDVDEDEERDGVPYSNSADGIDPVFGAGVGFKLNKMIGFQGEYERFIDVGEVGVTGQVDVDLITGSVVVKF
jgi:OOP family OmpA-OmpF porin